MPSTKTLLISIIGIIILIFSLAYWFISDLEASLNKEKELSEAAVKDEPIDPDRYVSENNLSTEDEELPTEGQFMKLLHGMTHQKVYAEDKWVLVEMTDERINNMLQILKQSKEEEQYQNYEFFLETLTEWKEGNYQNAVVVHNRIWELEGGTIGKAERLLTSEEEREFVNKHYD